MSDELSELRRQFAALGCDDPNGWAHSEHQENIAQLARFAFLRELWPERVSPWLRDRAVADEFLTQLVPDESKRKELGRFIAGQIYSTMFDLMYRLDEEGEDYRVDGYPGWRLMELDPQGELTGRDVGGLHESLVESELADREFVELIL